MLMTSPVLRQGERDTRLEREVAQMGNPVVCDRIGRKRSPRRVPVGNGAKSARFRRAGRERAAEAQACEQIGIARARQQIDMSFAPEIAGGQTGKAKRRPAGNRQLAIVRVADGKRPRPVGEKFERLAADTK